MHLITSEMHSYRLGCVNNRSFNFCCSDDCVHIGVFPQCEEDQEIMAILDNVSIDGLSVVFGVHRATAARRVAVARRKVLESVRALLSVEGRLTTREVTSLVWSVASRQEISLETRIRGLCA